MHIFYRLNVCHYVSNAESHKKSNSFSLSQDLAFIEPHNLLRFLQKPTGPYSQPDVSSSH